MVDYGCNQYSISFDQTAIISSVLLSTGTCSQKAISVASKKPSWDQASQLAEAVVRRASDAGNLEAMLTSMLATNYTHDPDQFESDWEKLFGNAEEVPASENIDATLEILERLNADIEKDDQGRVCTVMLHGARVTDETLDSIKGLKTLQKLYLKSTRVTNLGLEQLSELMQLSELNLSGTNVTDEGLVHLQALESLTMLYLDLTQVTDAGLDHLRELPRLRCLDLRKSKVTQAGIDDFKETRPDCEIAF